MVRNRNGQLGSILVWATTLLALALAISSGAMAVSLDGVPSSAVVAATHREMTATHFKPVLVEEGRSQSRCEAVPNRIFVKASAGSECIAYFVTRGFETRRDAVLYFNGDPSLEEGNEMWEKRNLEANKTMMQFWADQLKVRYIYVSRVGLQGSSGNHADRRFPKETIVMNAVVDGLKARLWLDNLALAGQSGGSTIAASLLTMGRKDVACEVLGSAPLDLVEQQFYAATRLGHTVPKAAISANVYDPSSHIDSIVARADRRVLLLGDPADTTVPFRFQSPFIDRIREAGHHGLAIEVEGVGSDHHDVAWLTLPVAGACLNGVPDDKIATRAARMTIASKIKDFWVERSRG
jgi:hypothetical protein